MFQQPKIICVILCAMVKYTKHAMLNLITFFVLLFFSRRIMANIYFFLCQNKEQRKKIVDFNKSASFFPFCGKVAGSLTRINMLHLYLYFTDDGLSSLKYGACHI